MHIYISELQTNLSYGHPQKPHCPIREVEYSLGIFRGPVGRAGAMVSVGARNSHLLNFGRLE